MSYEEWQVLRAPPWLQGENGAKLLGAIGRQKDGLNERVKQGVLARFPDYGASDSQNGVGADRQLPRGYLQRDADYAERLKKARDHYEGTDAAPGGLGSHAGMLRELKIQGFWPAYIVQDNGRYSTLDGAGALVVGWVGDSEVVGRPHWRFFQPDNFYSRFAIIFPGPLPPLIQVTATAVFVNSDRAVARWSQKWDDIDYRQAFGAPVTTGGAVVVNADESTKLPESVELVASSPFTGYVDLIGWREGENPFASPSVSTRNQLNELARLWKPGKMTYYGAIAMVLGRAWGWPLSMKWGDAGLKWGASSTVLFAP